MPASGVPPYCHCLERLGRHRKQSSAQNFIAFDKNTRRIPVLCQAVLTNLCRFLRHLHDTFISSGLGSKLTDSIHLFRIRK